jgi:hypothetical protein
VLGKTEYDTIEDLLKSKQIKHNTGVELSIKKPVSIPNPFERIFVSWKKQTLLKGYMQDDQ